MKFLDALNVSHNAEIIRNENFENGLSRRELLSSFLTWGKNKGSNILEDVIWHNQICFCHIQLNRKENPTDLLLLLSLHECGGVFRFQYDDYLSLSVRQSSRDNL